MERVWKGAKALLHHLVLSHARSFGFHSITSVCIAVFDVGEAERSSAVLVSSEFCCEVSSENEKGGYRRDVAYQ